MDKKNSLTPREISFREKQREKSAFQQPKVGERKIQESYKTVQFTGWPTIAKMDCSAYSEIMFYVKKVIQPNTDYEQAVGNLIVNLFSGSPYCFCQEGENERDYRAHTKSQLISFNSSLRTLEGLMDLETKEQLGNLGRKQIYWPRDISEMLNSPFYLGSNEFDLIALYNPSCIIPQENEAIKIAKEQLAGEIKRKSEKLLSDFNGRYDEKELEKACKKFDAEYKEDNFVFVDDFESVSLPDYQERVKNWIDKNQGLPTPIKDFLELTVDLKRAIVELEDDAKELVKTWTEPGIISGFSRNLMPKGILIVNSSTINAIDSFRQVDNYGAVTVYQKES